MKEYPYVAYEGEKYFLVGCVKCGEGRMLLHTNREKFIIACSLCNHTQEISVENIRDYPDRKGAFS